MTERAYSWTLTEIEAMKAKACAERTAAIVTFLKAPPMNTQPSAGDRAAAFAWHGAAEAVARKFGEES